MKIQIFAVYDASTQMYAQPNFLASTLVAKRMWPEAANDPNTQIGKYPQDFTLFHLGEYDDETGKFTNLHTPVSLGTALEAKAQLNKNTHQEGLV